MATMKLFEPGAMHALREARFWILNGFAAGISLGLCLGFAVRLLANT